MLVRCGGNVIEIGRRQIVLVVAAGILLLMMSVYSIALLNGSRRDDADWVQPIPIDHVLEQVVRDSHQDDVAHPIVRHSSRNKVETRQRLSLIHI